ncbi:hypothetical protein H4582DRAFT_2052324 [Lactarius indigo]|nr:hypothetical protein H4582DRAFT_2052324 [Lactarius indigo]
MGRRRGAETVIDYEPGILEVIITHRRTKRGIVIREKAIPIPIAVTRPTGTRLDRGLQAQREQRRSLLMTSSSSPLKVYFSHTQHTLTIFDAYPKALFHFLVLPRLSDERTAEETLRVLADEAERLRGVIEEEMRARYGFTWDCLGRLPRRAVDGVSSRCSCVARFSLAFSLIHLTAPALKTKRHYNSFSPRAGFFVPLAEVRAWFFNDATAPQLVKAKMRRLAPEEYEPRLKNALECFRCGQPAKNMPALKKHLQEEFDALRKREGKSTKRRSETEDESASDRETSGGTAKGKGKKVARLS